MADSCIVCLGDLAGSDSANGMLDIHDVHADNYALEDSAPVKHEVLESSPALANSIKTRRQSRSSCSHVAPLSSRLSTAGEESLIIAQLLPCGHHLHDECLKPWVERANSCPICRAAFNVVELKHKINGPSFSSYVVDDKRQVADLDPSTLLEDDLFDEPFEDTCIFCAHSSEDDVLVLCDGCDAGWHTHCAGLPEVPTGPWQCRFCDEARDGQSLSWRSTSTMTQRRTRMPTTQENVRRGSGQQQQHQSTRRGRRHGQSRGSSAWAQVWQSVWDGLNLDLDFPWAGESDNTTQRTRAQQREIAEWHRRFRVAERLGGATRFRNTVAALRPQNRAPTPNEELRAWNAFEKAKDMDSDNPLGSGRSKRKSVSASPAEPNPEPERKLKRPKTRRAENLGESSSDGGVSSARKAPSPLSHQQQANRKSLTKTQADSHNTGPSFFQTLLKEVENAPTTSEWDEQQHNPVDQATPTSPNLSLTPGPSPSIVGNNSSRGQSPSPPPLQLSRPSSPPPLSSRIEPIFARRLDSPTNAGKPDAFASHQRNNCMPSECYEGIDLANTQPCGCIPMRKQPTDPLKSIRVDGLQSTGWV